MSEGRPIEIQCPACGEDSLLLRRPQYDGFTRVGDVLSCAACGHTFEDDEAVPYKHREEAKVFTDADRSAPVEVFEEDEARRLCRYCVNYVVNPFMQWCGLHRREVEATDTCSRFAPKEEETSQT